MCWCHILVKKHRKHFTDNDLFIFQKEQKRGGKSSGTESIKVGAKVVLLYYLEKKKSAIRALPQCTINGKNLLDLRLRP